MVLANARANERRKDQLIFVHGSLGGAADAFLAQADLGDAFDLTVVTRRGYALDAEDPHLIAVDHDRDAVELAAQAARIGGAHLVGTSMGAIVAMKAAAIEPDVVRSLTLIEPPAYAIAADQIEISEAVNALKVHWKTTGLSNRQFMQGFLDALAMTRRVPDEVSPELDRAITLMRTERAWAIDLPLGAIAEAGIPTLVVAGGWSPIFDAICERLAGLIGARLERIVGFGHAVQKAGSAFNALLREHVRSAWQAGEAG